MRSLICGGSSSPPDIATSATTRTQREFTTTRRMRSRPSSSPQSACRQPSVRSFLSLGLGGVPVPATALNHFQQDIARARALVTHAIPLPAGTSTQLLLRSDLMRSGWMFTVGALDAYFCDAYTDVVAATIIAKSRHPALNLPEFFHDIRFPVRAILAPY